MSARIELRTADRRDAVAVWSVRNAATNYQRVDFYSSDVLQIRTQQAVPERLRERRRSGT